MNVYMILSSQNRVVTCIKTVCFNPHENGLRMTYQKIKVLSIEIKKFTGQRLLEKKKNTCFNAIVHI